MNCLKCGKCCTQFQIAHQAGPMMAELLRAHYDEDGPVFKLETFHVCERFDEEKARCKDYRARPMMCQVFDCTDEDKKNTLEERKGGK